jgi:hypothetical protein
MVDMRESLDSKQEQTKVHLDEGKAVSDHQIYELRKDMTAVDEKVDQCLEMFKKVMVKLDIKDEQPESPMRRFKTKLAKDMQADEDQEDQDE